MIFKFGKYKHYKKIIGRVLATPDGKDLGRITSIKVGRKSGLVRSIVYVDSSGNVKEVKVRRIIEISNGKVIADVEIPKEESKVNNVGNSIIGNIVDLNILEQSKYDIKRKIEDIHTKYGKLLELLINKEIDISIYSEVKDRLDKEKEEVKILCERKIREIDEKIRDIDYRTEDLKRRRSQLYVKKVLGNLTPEEEKELQIIDSMYREVEECKKRLYLLRQEIVSICSNI